MAAEPESTTTTTPQTFKNSLGWLPWIFLCGMIGVLCVSSYYANTYISDLRRDTATEINTLKQKLDKIQSQNAYDSQNFLLLKTRYLLELAELNATRTSDNQTTIAMLREADNLLAGINNPQIMQLRTMITGMRTQAEAARQPDYRAIINEINAIINLVGELPIKITQDPATPVTAPTPSEPQSGWKKALADNLLRLKNLVVIRHHDEDAIISMKGQQLFLQRSLMLTLKEAEWAILQGNAAVYQQTLTNARHMLERYFAPDHHATQVILEKLQQLQTLNPAPAGPDFAPALHLINTILDDQEKPVTGAPSP